MENAFYDTSASITMMYLCVYIQHDLHYHGTAEPKLLPKWTQIPLSLVLIVNFVVEHRNRMHRFLSNYWNIIQNDLEVMICDTFIHCILSIGMHRKGCLTNFVNTGCPSNFDHNKFNVITSCSILRSIQFLFLILSMDSGKSLNVRFADVAKVDAYIFKHSRLRWY